MLEKLPRWWERRWLACHAFEHGDKEAAGVLQVRVYADTKSKIITNQCVLRQGAENTPSRQLQRLDVFWRPVPACELTLDDVALGARLEEGLVRVVRRLETAVRWAPSGEPRAAAQRGELGGDVEEVEV